MTRAAAGLDEARERDAGDPLAHWRREFAVPRMESGDDATYLCGNSLGLMPLRAAAYVRQELDDWATLGVRGHFEAATPWYDYHETCRETGARLVGALPGEVVMMNGLTVNLHLMMASFYRPRGKRTKILIESTAFPSDRYAVQSHVRIHGMEPEDAVVEVAPRPDSGLYSTDDIVDAIDSLAPQLALVLLGGVSYLSGQLLDMEAIATACREREIPVGFDLAHAAGNVPLRLHDWGVDFAVWCSYKYLNAGPGGVAGCFVHHRHGDSEDLPRMAGWWGNNPETRFNMQSERQFVPRPGADGWQLSNPPILALAPVRASLEIFDEVGMERLREKSIALTGYTESLIREHLRGSVDILSPEDPAQRGCQLSLKVSGGSRELHRRLERRGIITDFRDPDVLRVAPVPLYNTFRDVARFVGAARQEVAVG